MATGAQVDDPMRLARTRARSVRDVAIRVVGIPFFGLAIPRVTGALDDLSWRDPNYWVGTAWFLGLSLMLWQGNRWLLFRRRARTDWLAEPGRSLVGLLLAHVLFTAPVTVAVMIAWYGVGPFSAVNWPELIEVTAVVVVAVLFVTHAYETMFLIQDRLEDRLGLERMERARLQADLERIKGQLAPHFLFNCLNALGILIAEDPHTARRYNQHMAQVCRYLLIQQRRDLVPLTEEAAFLHDYIALIRMRYAEGLDISLHGFENGAAEGLLIPPASLQLLLENVIKHNAFSEQQPLPVEVRLMNASLVVSNPLRLASGEEASTGTGLVNLRERFQLATGATIAVERSGGVFRVTLPLVRACARN